MSHFLARTLKLIALPACSCVLLAGCTGPNNGLPDAVTVLLPDGTEVQSTLGSGVITLANSQWDFLRVAANGQSVPFVRVQFGPAGELSAFVNSTIGQEIFGDTVIFDAQLHPTSQPPLEYAAATYGAETSDSSGFTFTGQITATVPVVGEVAAATATATAEFDPDDPNIVRGTFTFSVVFADVVSLLPFPIPEGGLDDEFSFEGRRVVE